MKINWYPGHMAKTKRLMQEEDVYKRQDIRYTCPRASYPKDAWIALAGPGANLLCCCLLYTSRCV